MASGRASERAGRLLLQQLAAAAAAAPAPAPAAAAPAANLAAAAAAAAVAAIFVHKAPADTHGESLEWCVSGCSEGGSKGMMCSRVCAARALHAGAAVAYHWKKHAQGCVQGCARSPAPSTPLVLRECVRRNAHRHEALEEAIPRKARTRRSYLGEHREGSNINTLDAREKGGATVRAGASGNGSRAEMSAAAAAAVVAGGVSARPSTAFKPGTATLARGWCVRRHNLQVGRRHKIKISGVGVRQDRAVCSTRRHHSSITRTLAGWEL